MKSQLFFLSEEYFIDFSDDKLMKNKDIVDGIAHKRPCFYAFPDTKNEKIFWMVPISSRCEKYKEIEQYKIRKYGYCNTIRFGTVLGRNTAFLIQNMCPTIERYLIPYIDKNNQPIKVDGRVAQDIEKNARDVLNLTKRGIKTIFPDVLKIYSELEYQLWQERTLSLNKQSRGKIL